MILAQILDINIHMKPRSNILTAVITLIGLIIFGTIVFHSLEDWSYIDSFYFTITTITTVGYGDLYPTSEVSRLFTAIFILLSVSIALAALGLIGSDYLQRRENRMLKQRGKRQKKKKEKKK